MMLVMGIPLLLLLMLSLVSGIVMIVGGLKMLRLQSYGWAMTACIIAVLPFNPVGFIGLIVGIWGLVVLNQPSVRAAFRGQPPWPKAGPPVAHISPVWWILLAVVGLLLIALPFVAAFLGW
jgi:hypothetical protein